GSWKGWASICHAVAPTASGPGSPLPAGRLPAKACQASTNTAPIATERQSTRSRSRVISGPSGSANRERLQIVVRLVGIEHLRLADGECVLHRRGFGRLLTEGAHRARGTRREEHILGHLPVAHVRLEIAP